MGLRREIMKFNIMITSGKVVVMLIGFFFSILLTRLLQPYYFGLFSFCLVIVGFSAFIDFGLSSTLIRFVAYYSAKRKYREVKTITWLIFKYKFIITLLSGLLVLIFSQQIATFIFNKPEVGTIVFFSGFILILQSIFLFFNSLFSGLKDFKTATIMLILEKIFIFIFVISLIVLGLNIIGALSGLILTYLLLIPVSIFILYRKHKFIIKEPSIEINKKSLFSFSFWVGMGVMATIVFGLTDQIMISMFMSIEDIGFYRIGLTWMMMIASFLPITIDVLYPYFSGASGITQLNKMFFDSLRYISMIIFPLAFLLSAFSEPIITIFYTGTFSPAIPVLRILALVAIPLIIATNLKGYFIAMDKPDIRAKVTLFVLFINILLMYTFIRLWGIVGAAMGLLISYSLEFLIFLLIAIFIKGAIFKYSTIFKPFLASIVIYFIARLFIINNLFDLILYGIICLALYIVVMFAIRGVDSQDISYIKREIFLILHKLK